MNVLGWVLLAVGGWILLAALAVGSWVWLGRWHNRRQFLHHAATLRDDARDNGGFDEGDDLDDVCRSVGVLCDDSRVMARWCDQPTIDRLFAGMVAVHRSQVHNHTDKES